MTRTQTLESITKELYVFSKNYKNQHENGIAKEFEDTAKAVDHLVKVYNYGYEGYEIDVLNKHISKKLSALNRIIKAQYASQQNSSMTVIGILNNYSTLIKTNS